MMKTEPAKSLPPTSQGGNHARIEQLVGELQARVPGDWRELLGAAGEFLVAASERGNTNPSVGGATLGARQMDQGVGAGSPAAASPSPRTVLTRSVQKGDTVFLTVKQGFKVPGSNDIHLLAPGKDAPIGSEIVALNFVDQPFFVTAAREGSRSHATCLRITGAVTSGVAPTTIPQNYRFSMAGKGSDLFAQVKRFDP